VILPMSALLEKLKKSYRLQRSSAAKRNLTRAGNGSL